jgi:hypothetical protein
MSRPLPGEGSVSWPEGKRFAFTIFDDPDSQDEATSRLIYSFLEDLGFRTTKAVWPLEPRRTPNSPGETCASGSFRRHCQQLQERGFEIAFHNATLHSCRREETIEALDRFREYFGHDPVTMANHYNEEAIYWGPARLSGPLRWLYLAATLGRTRRRHFGHVPGHGAFWGDICRARIRYCRNFVYSDIDTLRACPWMPYHDPARPFVRAWFAATEGANRPAFLRAVTEANLERLEARGGACIVYTHFGHGFADGKRLDAQFAAILRRLALRPGWFVPAGTLLAFLEEQRGLASLDGWRRFRLESTWLFEKLFRGTS